MVDKERISRLTAELAAAQETLTKRDSMLDKLTASHDRLTAENERLKQLTETNRHWYVKEPYD